MKRLRTTTRASEVDGISNRILLLYQREQISTDTLLSTMMAAIETYSEQITEAIKRDKVLSELEDMDAERDDYIRALFNLAKGYASFPVPDIQQIGRELKRICDKYTLSITRASYDAESSYVESLLKDLALPEMTTLAGVPQVIAQLAEANNRFVAKRVAFEHHRVKYAEGLKITEVKVALVNAINELATYLELMVKHNSAIYATFAKELEQYLEVQATIQANRKKRSVKEMPITEK